MDWQQFPKSSSEEFIIDNTISNVTPRTLLVRRKNAEPVGHYYMGDWDSTSAYYDSTKLWANDIGDLPRPVTNSSNAVTTMGSKWRAGYWWRIKNTVTINNVTYNEDDILVYKALLVHTSTNISNPSTNLAWKVYSSTALAVSYTHLPLPTTPYV